MSIMTRTRQHLGMLLMLLATATAVAAGEAKLEVPDRAGEVGSSLRVDIIITNAVDNAPPNMPDVEGLRIERLSRPSVRESWGRIGTGQSVHTREVIWTFGVTADHAGEYTIPEFEINVDDTIALTKPFTLSFVDGQAKDLLRVAVDGTQNAIYLGESTTVSLKIWIKPYNDGRSKVDPAGMWSLLLPTSDFGPFTQAIQRQRSQGRVVQVPGVEAGKPGLAYLYEVQAEVQPDRVGLFDASTIRLDMQYPLRIARGRILNSENISASPSPSDLEVLPLPTDDQPDWFSGAVGRYDFDVTASPTDVAVGDPITLTMTIRDRSRRAADLALLQAPALDRMPELEADFRVPREQLGGSVQGRTKTFTQTIRADNDAVSEIPALPFAYFDPMSRTYKTSWSQPIPLVVSASAQISTEDVLAASGPIQKTPESLRTVAGGILANYTGPQLLEDQSSRPGFGWLLLLLLPPLAVIGTATAHRHRMQLNGDSGRARARTALRTARGRLDHATGIADIAAALTGYIADRLNLPEGGLTRQDIVTRLNDVDVPRAIIDQVDAVLIDCEQRHFAGGVDTHDATLAAHAGACIDALEGARLR